MADKMKMGGFNMESHRIMLDLRRLGIGRQYRGYKSVIKAVRMVLLDEDRLLCLKSGVYQPLSEEEKRDWRAIERNLRTIIHRAWCVNPEYLSELAGFPLDRPPTVTEFVDMLTAHAQKW